MRVLVIEPPFGPFSERAVACIAQGWAVEVAVNGDEGLYFATLYPFDAIVLDAAIADITATAVIASLRAKGNVTPVLVTSADPDVSKKVAALAAGADDYLVHPVHRDELTARIIARARRSVGQVTNEITCGPLTIDIGRRKATVHGVEMRLTGREYQVLELLAVRKGSSVSKSAIMDHLYAGRDEPEVKIIDVWICRLRKRLRQLGAPGLLHTEWGEGYSMTAPIHA